MVIFWEYSGNSGKCWENVSSPRTDTGTTVVWSFPWEIFVSDQTMLVIFWEILGYWEILGHVKTCHPTAFCCWDKYGLRNSCYWDTGTNGDFSITETLGQDKCKLKRFSVTTMGQVCTSKFYSTETNVWFNEKLIYIWHLSEISTTFIHKN